MDSFHIKTYFVNIFSSCGQTDVFLYSITKVTVLSSSLCQITIWYKNSSFVKCLSGENILPVNEGCARLSDSGPVVK